MHLQRLPISVTAAPCNIHATWKRKNGTANGRHPGGWRPDGGRGWRGRAPPSLAAKLSEHVEIHVFGDLDLATAAPALAGERHGAT